MWQKICAGILFVIACLAAPYMLRDNDVGSLDAHNGTVGKIVSLSAGAIENGEWAVFEAKDGRTHFIYVHCDRVLHIGEYVFVGGVLRRNSPRTYFGRCREPTFRPPGA